MEPFIEAPGRGDRGGFDSCAEHSSQSPCLRPFGPKRKAKMVRYLSVCLTQNLAIFIARFCVRPCDRLTPMSEGPSKRETAPSLSGFEAYEALVTKGEWTAETEVALDSLIEKHEEDLYMLFLNYRESGLVDELPEHERRMYDRLAAQFE